MKAREYMIIQRCVEEGIERGHQRAFKYADSPTKHVINGEIFNAVMNELNEYFTFDNGEAE